MGPPAVILMSTEQHAPNEVHLDAEIVCSATRINVLLGHRDVFVLENERTPNARFW